MKKIFIQLLVFTIIIELFAVSAWIQEAHAAAGTPSDPHIIMNENDLSNIRLDLAAHYRLGTNIDLSGYDYDGAGSDTGGWMPIGPAFSGSLDGNGYTISNMRINRPLMEEVGLFSSMDSTAKLIDIRLLDIEVVGDRNTGGLVGVLIGGTIENSYATGRVFTFGFFAGGLVGNNVTGIIENSYAFVDVSGDVIGGLVGRNTGTIRNAYAAGSVSGFSQAGGLVAHTYNGAIINSYALGNVYGDIYADIGGLVGLNNHFSPSTITGSYWNMDTTGQAGSSGGMGKTTEEMKNMVPLDWDSSVWGFVEGETYPYLRSFGMGMGVDPLAVSTYSLKPGQDALSVTGSVYHESAMEPINVQYIIRDSFTGDVKMNDTYPLLGSDALRPINRRFSLSGYSSGGYTLTVKATDNHKTTVGTTLVFTVNASAAAPPTVHFSNNDEAWVHSASTTVTINDSGGGINTSTAQYSWSTDSATPGPGADWFPFAIDDTLTKSGDNGDVYLHVRVEDDAGVTANVVSNRFRLDNVAPMINFSTNGNETLAQSASTMVTVTDAGAGVDASSLQYAWTDDTATPTSWTSFASGDPLTISGVEGDRYLHIEASDGSGNTTNVVSNRFRLDNVAPTISFSTNGSETLAQSASSTVTVTDAGAGVNAASLQYAWTEDTAMPTSWTTFVSGDLLAISAVNGDRYLHIEVSDAWGQTANVVSNRFRLDNTAPTINFSTNGSEVWAQSASTVVTVTDAGAGVDASSLQYAWTEDTATPTSWTSFASGDPLTISAVNGDRYLHIEASDALGNTTNIVSNRFRLRASVSPPPEQPSVPKSVIDLNGTILDPDSIDLTKLSVTLDVEPKNGMVYVNIPANILIDFANRNASFFIEIKTPYGSYQVPVNLAAFITGLDDLLAASNLKAEDISFKITLTDKSDDKDIQKAFADSVSKGNVSGAIVDFHLEVMNTKTKKAIGTVDQFSQALTKVIPMPKSMISMPEHWGAFRYNETKKKFEFVPAQSVQIDGVWYVMIRTYTNSIYAVANNPVSFTDTLHHWGISYIELSAAKGLVEGVGGDKFEPDRSITKAEFTAMLIRALGYRESTDATTPYSDVKLGSWYYDVIVIAKEHGLLDFVTGSSFMPDQSLTREEMASLLTAVIELEKLPMTKELVSLDRYKDVGNIDVAYLEDVRMMVKLNIMTGTSSNTFNPKGESTRAQAGVVLVKTLKALGMID